MIGLATLRRMARSHPRTTDALVAAVTAGSALLAPLGDVDAGGDPSTGSVVAAVLAFGLILVRRRWPVPVLALATVGAIGFTPSTGHNSLYLAMIIALYTVTRSGLRPGGAVIAIAASGALYVVSTLLSADSWENPDNLGLLAWTGLAAAAGTAIRNRQAYVESVEERARRAEENREEEARRRVAEERLRIARELHDVVAHHVALINVQVRVASHLLAQQPQAARTALEHAGTAGQTILDELGTIVNTLQETETTSVPTEPAPGLDRLDRLIDSFANAGLQVRSTVAGQVRALPPIADLTAYRVVQEALTNVQRHGRGAPARLHLSYGPAALTIQVDNDGVPGPRPIASDTSQALVGARERLAAIGGRLRSGPTGGGGFQVTASLPMRPAEHTRSVMPDLSVETLARAGTPA